jgi:hypothetical protein
LGFRWPLFLRLRKPLCNHGALHLRETVVAGYSFTGVNSIRKLLSSQDFPLQENQGFDNEPRKKSSIVTHNMQQVSKASSYTTFLYPGISLEVCKVLSG